MTAPPPQKPAPQRELSLWRCRECSASVCVDSPSRALRSLRATSSLALSTVNLLFSDKEPPPEAPPVPGALDLKAVFCPCCTFRMQRVKPDELGDILAAGQRAVERGELPDMGRE